MAFKELNLHKEDFSWLEEDHVKSKEESIELVRKWRDLAEDMRPKNDTEERNRKNFLSASNDLLENPDVYDQDLYHGTTSPALGNIMQELVLRPSAPNGQTGEHQSLPRVSSTSNIYDAVAFAEMYTPVLSDVKNSVENDITGGDLNKDISRRELRNLIANQLNGELGDWLVNGEPYEENLELFAQKNFSFSRMRRWQERNYYGMAKRIEEIGEERGKPVVFGYPLESLKEEVREIYTPLHQDELHFDVEELRLAEIQSKVVDLDCENTAIFLDEEMRSDFQDKTGSFEKWNYDEERLETIEFDYEGRLSAGSLDALKIYQLAKNSEKYAETQRIRDDTPQWEGNLIIPQHSTKRKSFDPHDLGSNPYEIQIT